MDKNGASTSKGTTGILRVDTSVGGARIPSRSAAAQVCTVYT